MLTWDHKAAFTHQTTNVAETQRGQGIKMFEHTKHFRFDPICSPSGVSGTKTFQSTRYGKFNK